ncbi:putative delta-60 repeat protein [Rhizobium rosettiformans]|uniref:Protein kinase domain-containing protein n=2 Tax=Rhizobium rosettiformans TaxID=1368430 RepID=A0A4V4HPE9_9HYPH|nr:serine/threonine-protein kinase [Rhizobium rosettiformans]MBB5278716.1 putative delta-60 repeat protein [Rhizobium rosettiformans]THV29696.1 hypothetical protein FAA86_23530 [Rhizobium rosettiformans W3]
MEYKNALPANTMLRQYRIEKVLGQGGFGITYLAYDVELQRQVAIKECYPRDFVMREGTAVTSATPQNEVDYKWALGKFMDEATTLAKFRHPGIVQVLQILKEENNTAYMVLEFVRGQSLDNWLKTLPGPPSQAQLDSILQPILDALSSVHRENIAHRDIAPDNIYIRPSGEALLLDFGAARLTLGQHSKTLNLVVKDGYSAPEQYYSEGRQGPWTDIYALSATLYRCIAGKKPPDAMARLDAINNGEPDPMTSLEAMGVEGYSSEYLAAIQKGLAPQTKSRPQSIQAWRKDLVGDAISAAPAISHVVTSTQTKPDRGGLSKSKPAKPQGSHLVAYVSAAVLMIAAGAGYWLYQGHLQAEEAQAWATASELDNESTYASFIRDYPDSPKVDQARQNVAALSSAWDVTLGDGRKGEALASATRDNLITVAGYEVFDTPLKQQAVVYRLSRSGKIVWTAAFGEAGEDVFHAVTQLADGSVIAVGEATTSGDTRSDAIVARFTPKGEVAWARRFGGPGSDRLLSVVQRASGNFVSVGTTTKNINSLAQGWMLEISPQGELIDDRNFDHPDGGMFTSVVETVGGGLVAAGQTGDLAGSDPDFWIIRLSSDGAVLLDRQPGGSGVDRINGMTVGANGDILLAGETTSFGTSTADGIILRLTPDNKMPPKVLAKQGQDRLASIATDSGGYVYAAGSSDSAGTEYSSAWIVKLSPDLRTTVWESTGTDSSETMSRTLSLMDDGSIIVAGRTTDLDTNRPSFRIHRMFPDRDESGS